MQRSAKYTAEPCAADNGGQSRRVCSLIVGERGGTAFPFHFRRENAIPLVYTTAEGVGGETQRTPASAPSLAGNLNFALNFEVTPGVTVNHALYKTVNCSDFVLLKCCVIINCTKFGQLIIRKMIAHVRF